MADVFRQAASVLVLRPVSEGLGYQLLLLHKPRKRDAWQLPQGGIEAGESVTQAAARELQEEASLDCTIIGESDHVYEYTFPASFRRFRPDNVKGQQVRYVYARVDADATVVVDQNEIDAYVWVDLGEVSRYVKRKAYVELVRKLYKEAVDLLRKV